MSKTKGFRPQPRHYKLIFTDEELDGLEVTVRRGSIREMLDFQELAGSVAATWQEGREQAQKIASFFANVLVGWNLLDADGEPVPATAQAVLDQDDALMAAVVKAWVTAITGVSGPLGVGSTSGVSFPEESLPMESL